MVLILYFKAVIDPELTVIVPDFNVKTVTTFLSLLYTGAANLTEHDELVTILKFEINRYSTEDDS